MIHSSIFTSFFLWLLNDLKIEFLNLISEEPDSTILDLHLAKPEP